MFFMFSKYLSRVGDLTPPDKMSVKTIDKRSLHIYIMVSCRSIFLWEHNQNFLFKQPSQKPVRLNGFILYFYSSLHIHLFHHLLCYTGFSIYVYVSSSTLDWQHVYHIHEFSKCI